MNLHIFDVSQYIAAGAPGHQTSVGFGLHDGHYSAQILPTGGIVNVLNCIYYYEDENNELAFCFDRPPEIKRRLHSQLFPRGKGYKGNRPTRAPEIGIQRACVEEMLRAMGYPCIAADKYEADDCIYSLVQRYVNSYEHIYIHNRDSDLAQLVTHNVTIEPVCRQGKHLDLANWRDEVNSKYVIEYGTLFIHKLIYGESGDNIPPISKAMAKRINNFILPDMFPHLVDQQYLRQMIQTAVDNDPTVMGTLDLLLLLDIPREASEIFSYDIDLDLSAYFAKKLNCRSKVPLDITQHDKGQEILVKYADMYRDC